MLAADAAQCLQPHPAPGAGPAASASCGTSQAAAPPKAADVESQLAALSSKLGQLTLCLQTMQQQPAVVAAACAPGRGDRARCQWGWGGRGVAGEKQHACSALLLWPGQQCTHATSPQLAPTPARPGPCRCSDSEAGRFYFVFDTNVFMDHSRMIK